MGPIKQKKNKPSSRREVEDNPHKIGKGEPLPKNVVLELIEKNYSILDMVQYFGCSKWKVENTIKQMEVSSHGFKKPGVVIDRELKRKNKPFTSRRILRIDYFTKPVLEQDSEDNVLAPLSLTHFGAFDKLSRWGFFVHSGMDVYSRFILYMELSDTNDAKTVLSHFRKGVEAKGLPVAVRCDTKEEISGVVQFMDLNRPNVKERVQYREPGIAGHSYRFSYVWRHLLRTCLQPYRATFKDLEEKGQLDSSNPVDIYCLHQCYTHLIKADLLDFVNMWNHHNIQTAGQMTPTHLFYVGMHNIQRRAGLEGIHFPELDEKPIIEVDADHEWQATSHPSIYRRVLKKKKDRAELREKFPQESITFESAPDTFRKMRRVVKKIVNRS